MTSEFDKLLYTRLRTAARWLCIAIQVTALAVIAGWIFHIEQLVRPIPHLVAMNPLTAACFIMCASALLLLAPLKISVRSVLIARTLAILVLLIALLRLMEFLPAWHFSVSDLLFHKTVLQDAAGQVVSNRMAPNTAFLFLCAATGLFGLHQPGRFRRVITPAMACITCLGAFITLTGYLYQVQIFYGALATLPMAIHTAGCFLMLGLALLFAQPGRGVMREIISTFSGGSIARLLLSAAIVLPFVLGLAVLHGYWRAYFTTELALAVLVFSLVLALCLLIWYNTRELNRRDRQQAAVNRVLESTNHSLLRANEELERFAYVSSHDLQEPLRKIRMYCSLLAHDIGKPPDIMQQNIGKIDHAANRMSLLIQDLLYLTRVQQTEDGFTDTDLGEVLTQVLGDYEVSIAEKGAVIKAGPLPVLRVIPSQISQLFSNLIGNALKFTRTAVPVITIDARDATEEDIALVPGLPRQKPYMLLTISDNGIGFEQEYADKIFVIFQRLNNRNAFAGSGIGLAICKKIALNHFGDIRATGAINKGAAFQIFLLRQ